MTEIIHRYTGEPHDVMQWLIDNIPHHRLKWLGTCGIDAKGNYIWRMSASEQKRVLFDDREAAVAFALRWT